jgi:hypothetical protein
MSASSARVPAEGAARGGDHERRQLLARQLAEALLEGGVFGVDRQDRPTSPPRGGKHELAARHEALLVREGEVEAPLERVEAGLEPGGADHGVEHDRRAGGVDQLDERARAAQDRPAELGRGTLSGGRIGQRQHLGSRGARGRDETLDVRARGQRDDLEVIMRGDDVQCLRPDRAGRAEDGDALHLLTWCQSLARTVRRPVCGVAHGRGPGRT